MSRPQVPIDYARVAVAALAAMVADLLYGTLVYGTLMANEISMYGAVYRRVDRVNANLPWLIVGLALAMGSASYLYARSRQTGGGLVEGLRFGGGIGLLIVGYVAIGNYVVMRIGEKLAGLMGVAAFGEWLLIGGVLGLVYRPRESQ